MYQTFTQSLKKIKTLVIATILLSTFCSNQVAAQCTGTTISLTFTVYGTPLTYIYTYDKMVNGKCGYIDKTASNTTIGWDGTQWNIYDNLAYSGSIVFFSTKNTSNMPPDFTVGDWQASSYATTNGAVLTGFSGSGTTTILPIKLLSFTGSNSGASNNLQWTTASETNNASFAIERSANGVNFNAISSVNGAGTSSSAKQYTYTDAAPLVGANYYRLKQIDINGAFEYSNAIVVTAKSAATSSLAIYPNPANNIATLTVSNTYLNTTAQLYNIEGKLQQTIMVKNNQQAINVQPLAKGIYLLKLNDGAMLKLIKQ
jgi:hypothetical protein